MITTSTKFKEILLLACSKYKQRIERYYPGLKEKRPVAIKKYNRLNKRNRWNLT